MPVKNRSLNELLWDVSYYTMRDTVSFRSHVKQMVPLPGATYPPTAGATTWPSACTVIPATLPEETTTDNLVHHLGVLGKGKVTAVLHNKNVEGGQWASKQNNVYQRIPSGADLQLGVLLPNQQPLEYLLQAKRLAHDKQGRLCYPSWKRSQNIKLMRWASLNGQMPGMLLYNDRVAPFDQGGKTCGAFGACSYATQLWGADSHQMVRAGRSLTDGTPGGVSLCFDPVWLRQDAPTPTDLHKLHFPLEHLAHSHSPTPGGSGPGGNGPQGTPPPAGDQRVTDGEGAETPDELETRERPVALAPQDNATAPPMASWIEQLLSLSGEDADGEFLEINADPEFPIGAYVVIDLREDA